MKGQQFLCPFNHLRFYNYNPTGTDLQRYSSYKSNFTTNLMARLYPPTISGRQMCLKIILQWKSSQWYCSQVEKTLP